MRSVEVTHTVFENGVEETLEPFVGFFHHWVMDHELGLMGVVETEDGMCEAYQAHEIVFPEPPCKK